VFVCSSAAYTSCLDLGQCGLLADTTKERGHNDRR
jgi:hypothetical protein